MITAAIAPSPSQWRRRAGVSAAAALGIVAIAGGMSAGLQSSARWTNEASAAVIPDVLYLEEDHVDAKIKTIARVNGDIAREVTVDVGVEALTRPRQARDDVRTAPTLMDDGSADQAEHGKSDAADSSATDAGAGDATAPGNSTDHGGAPDAGDRSGGASGDAGTGATDPVAPVAPATGPRVDEPASDPAPADPAPTPTTPTRGSGAPQNDKDRTTDGKGPKPTVDAKSGSTDTTRTEVNP